MAMRQFFQDSIRVTDYSGWKPTPTGRTDPAFDKHTIMSVNLFLEMFSEELDVQLLPINFNNPMEIIYNGELHGNGTSNCLFFDQLIIKKPVFRNSGSQLVYTRDTFLDFDLGKAVHQYRFSLLSLSEDVVSIQQITTFVEILKIRIRWIRGLFVKAKSGRLIESDQDISESRQELIDITQDCLGSSPKTEESDRNRSVWEKVLRIDSDRQIRSSLNISALCDPTKSYLSTSIHDSDFFFDEVNIFQKLYNGVLYDMMPIATGLNQYVSMLIPEMYQSLGIDI